MFLFDEDRAEQQVRSASPERRRVLIVIFGSPSFLRLLTLAVFVRSQFHYRTVMINWLFTPGMTFKELAAKSKDRWERYLNYAHASGFGGKDAAVPWGEW